MKFSLTIDDANELYKFAKAFIDPKCSRESFTLIACELDGGVLTATMLNGVALCKIKVKATGENGMCFIAPPQKKFKAQDCFIDIDDSKTETSYTTAGGTQTFRKPYFEPRVFSYPMDKEPKETLWIDPSLLSKTIGAFDKNVRVDFLGKREGLYLSDKKGNKAVVLPMNPPKGEN